MRRSIRWHQGWATGAGSLGSLAHDLVSSVVSTVCRIIVKDKGDGSAKERWSRVCCAVPNGE